MPSVRSAPCAHPGCRRSTRDATGRCHDHRGAHATRSPVRRGTGIPPAPKTDFSDARVERVEDGTFVTDSFYGYDDYGTEVLSRLDGPAEIVRRRNGTPVSEDYYYLGRLHRQDGPASLRFLGDGSLHAEEWWENGVRHRDGDEPTMRIYFSTGEIYEEAFHVEGALSRIDGPAKVSYYRNGSRKAEHFYTEGRFRLADEGPGEIEYDEQGRKRTEIYYGPTGDCSRIDGPVKRTFGEDGLLVDEQWSFRGSSDNPAAFLANLEERELRAEIGQSSYGTLLDEGADPYAIVTAIGAEVTTIEGIREVLRGAPAEWVRAFEESR